MPVNAAATSLNATRPEPDPPAPKKAQQKVMQIAGEHSLSLLLCTELLLPGMGAGLGRNSRYFCGEFPSKSEKERLPEPSF